MTTMTNESTKNPLPDDADAEEITALIEGLWPLMTRDQRAEVLREFYARATPSVGKP